VTQLEMTAIIYGPNFAADMKNEDGLDPKISAKNWRRFIETYIPLDRRIEGSGEE